MDPRPAVQYPTPQPRTGTPSISVPRVATGIMLFDDAPDAAPPEPADPVAQAFAEPTSAPEVPLEPPTDEGVGQAPLAAAPDDGPTLVPMRHRNELAEGPTVVASPATFVPVVRDWLWVVVAAAGAFGAVVGALLMR
ncbi:MAG: hypothetical protein ABMA64_37810 [Myxococcota bacterium]